MIRLVGAAGGAEVGEGRLSVCNGLWGGGGWIIPTVQGVWVSHVPTQASFPVLHIPKGRISSIQEHMCLWQLTNLSLVPGSSTVSLQQEMAPTAPCPSSSHKLQVPWHSHIPAAGGSTTGKSSCTSQHPVLPTGHSHFFCVLPQLQSTVAASRSQIDSAWRITCSLFPPPFSAFLGF